ncbi:MAG: MFS transporter [Anaerovoracaceae bacterium]
MNNTWKKNTAIFILSQQFSLFGSALVSFAITWYITLETSSGKMMMISIICSFVPQILISLFAGVWADRYNKKVLIMLADALVAVATGVVILFFIFGRKSFIVIFAASAVRSIGGGIQMPAVGAMLPLLVPKEKLTRINGINSTATSISCLISPALGGLLLGTIGLEAAMMTDVITAVIAIIIMMFLKYEFTPEIKEETGMIKEIREGIKYTKEHPFLMHLLIYYCILFFLVTPAAFLSPLMIERSFGPEVWRLTVNEITWTAGALLGGLYVSIKGSFKDYFVVLAVTTLCFGVAFGLLGLAPNFALYLVVMTIAGIFMPIFSTAEYVIIQTSVDEKIMGRVFSLMGIIATATMPLGMLVFGPLGDIIKIEYLMIGTGIGMIALSPYILRCRKEVSCSEKSDK